MPSTYYNLLGYVWMKEHKGKTYRIIPGINRNLPNGLECEGKLKLISRTEHTMEDAIINVIPQKTPEEILKEKFEDDKNKILLDEEITDIEKKKMIGFINKTYRDKLKETKNEKI